MSKWRHPGVFRQKTTPRRRSGIVNTMTDTVAMAHVPSHVARVGDGEGAPAAAASTLLSLPPPSPSSEETTRQSLANVGGSGAFRLLAQGSPWGGAARSGHRDGDGHGGGSPRGGAWDRRRMTSFEVEDRAGEGVVAGRDPPRSSIRLQPTVQTVGSAGCCPPP